MIPISRTQTREALGIDIWHCVNTGLCLIERSTIDFDLCERALTETSLMSKRLSMVEHTLFAICASAVGRGGLLPTEYEATKEKAGNPQAVARHYMGSVRDCFYSEGVPRLKKELLPK